MADSVISTRVLVKKSDGWYDQDGNFVRTSDIRGGDIINANASVSYWKLSTFAPAFEGTVVPVQEIEGFYKVVTEPIYGIGYTSSFR